MKIVVDNYIFVPSTRKITFSDYPTIKLTRGTIITHMPSNTIIYQFNKAGKGGTVAVGTNVLTLAYNTTALSATDELSIRYELPDDGINANLNQTLPANFNNRTRANRIQTGYTEVRDLIIDSTLTGISASNSANTVNNLNNEVLLMSGRYVADYHSIFLTLLGTWTGTIRFYVSSTGIDSSWLGVNLQSINGLNVALGSAATGNNAFSGNLYGAPFFRVTAQLSAGKVLANVRLGTMPVPFQANNVTVAGQSSEGGTRSGNSVTVAGYDGTFAHTLRTDGAGNLYSLLKAATGFAANTYRLVTAASLNSNTVKASAATIYGVEYINDTASSAYLKIYQKATAPTVGTDSVFKVYKLEANKTFRYPISAIGINIVTGLSIGVTGALSDTDTTNTLAGININIDYV